MLSTLNYPSKKNEKIVFTKEEINKIWHKWGNGSDIAGYILIMIYSGIRTGELKNIQICNIDIEKQIMFGGIKTEKGRSRPIVKYFMKTNKEKLCDLSEYVFYKKWNELKMELQLRDELAPNCSRHTCATALAEANIPPAVIMDILGHEKYDTTLNYTHINIDNLIKSMENSIGTI